MDAYRHPDSILNIFFLRKCQMAIRKGRSMNAGGILALIVISG